MNPNKLPSLLYEVWLHFVVIDEDCLLFVIDAVFIE